MRLPKAIKYSETEKSHVWRIAKLQTYNAQTKQMSSSGKNLLLRTSKAKPSKLYFYVKDFYFDKMAVRNISANDGYSVFSIKNGKLNLYSINPADRTVKCRNKSIGSLKIPNKAEMVVFRRFLSVFKNFLIENNYRFLPKVGVKDRIEFEKEILKCIYPGLRIFKNDVAIGEKFPSEIFRTKINFKEAVRKATGTKGKKTIKLFAENVNKFKNISIFNIVRNKGLVPLEVIQELTEKEFNFYCNKAPYRKLLKRFSQDARTRLVKEAVETTSITIRDTIRFFGEHPCEIRLT